MNRWLLGVIIGLVLVATYFIIKPVPDTPIYDRFDGFRLANMPSDVNFRSGKVGNYDYIDGPHLPSWRWSISGYGWTWYSESNGVKYTHLIGVRHNSPDWVNYRVVSNQSVSEDKIKEEAIKYVINMHRLALEYNFYDFRQDYNKVRLYEVPTCIGATPPNGSCLFISGQSTRFPWTIREGGQEKKFDEKTRLIDMTTLEVSDETFLSSPKHAVKYLTYKYSEYGTPTSGSFSGPSFFAVSVNYTTETHYLIHTLGYAIEEGKMKWVVSVMGPVKTYFITTEESGNNTIEEWKKYN